jgi:hypothetical protein
VSSHQRRRGIPALIWRSKDTVDRRGNTSRVVDLEERPKDHPDGVNPHRFKVAQVPQRSAKAEVPGQQTIEVVRLVIPAGLPDVDIYSRAEVLGKVWDVVTPPAYHHGTRHTRHETIDLRRRPA